MTFFLKPNITLDMINPFFPKQAAIHIPGNS
jgi:hypothetical protein